jgi:hypothetical protein
MGLLSRAISLGVMAVAGIIGPAAARAAIDPVAGGSPPPQFVEPWTEFVAGSWQEQSQYGNWSTRYAGFGSIEIVGTPPSALELYPAPTTEPGTTHAGLVTTTQSFGNVLMAATFTTVKQLRTPSPNPWEVGWLLWHYIDDRHFYYLILKPNGWELGKKVPDSRDQHFLLAGAEPAFPIGAHTVQVLQIGPTIQVVGDGMLLGTYVDRDDPYLSGSIGLYTEDAHVRFGALSAEPLP